MQTVDGRFPPRVPAAAMKTYQVVAPLSTHWRTVSCAEYQCDAYLQGWVTRVDESTELGQRQAWFIRRESGRRFTEDRDDAGLTVFTFEPGQQGFASRDPASSHDGHRVRLDRPERFIRRGGDWRGNPLRDHFEHKTAESWQDDFATHQERIRAFIEGAGA